MNVDEIVKIAQDNCAFEILSITEVGSRMWNMESISSDHDLFVTFIYPTANILRGLNVPKSMLQLKIEDLDIQRMEIGHLIGLLIKGNINTVWGVTSPLLYYTSDLFDNLREYVLTHPTRDLVHSAEGMAKSQWMDSIKRKDTRDSLKSKLTAMRTLEFAITYLATGSCEFNPYNANEISDLEYYAKLEGLKSAHLTSNLDYVPQSHYQEWLLNLRINNYFLNELKK